MDEFEIAACSVVGLLVSKAHTAPQIVGFAEIVIVFLIAWRLFAALQNRILAGVLVLLVLAATILVTVTQTGMDPKLLAGCFAGIQGLVIGAVLVRFSRAFGDWLLGAYALLVLVRISLF